MTARELVGSEARERRRYWVSEIVKLSGDFGQDSARLETELAEEVAGDGSALLDHLRLCGAIPEGYPRNSSEEKLYSKYTDVVIAYAFRAMGLRSHVLTERVDVADVECFGADFSFVADAKAFRMSRTAKNQKDFKVQAMDGWKHGKPFAVVVPPLYQLPERSSQIYMQAGQRNVAILSYSHLAVLAGIAERAGTAVAESTLLSILRSVEAMTPSKDAVGYWQIVNRTLLDADECCSELWASEQLATEQALSAAKADALEFLDAERERIVGLSHGEAIDQLLSESKIGNRTSVVEQLSTNQLLDVSG